MEIIKRIGEWIRRDAVGQGLTTSWRDWQRPGGFLAAIVLSDILFAALPPVLAPLKHLVSILLHLGFWGFSGIAVARFFFASLRREERLRALLSRGENAPAEPLIALLDAELSSRPALLRPHLADFLEMVRASLAGKIADPASGLQASLTPAVRKWLFGATPPGSFPAYAADLVDLAERAPALDCLPLLRDLRDPGAHIAANDAERALRGRADALIDRIVGTQEAEAPVHRRGFRRLLDRATHGRDPGRARAEQALRAMGPAAVEAMAGLRGGRRLWWRLPGLLFFVGCVTLWYVGTRHITPDIPAHLPAEWSRALASHIHAKHMPAQAPSIAALGAVLVLVTWLLSFPVGWSRYRTRRAMARVIQGLSLIEGREAVEALLERLRTWDAHEPVEGRRLKARARAARRLAGLPPDVAAELLVPHGGWFFRRPTPGIKLAEWTKAVLAAVRHTWDPASRALLKSWANDPQSGVQAEADATLQELEARLSRQGTLLRPATATPDSLLRPAGTGTVQPEGLLRSSEAPESLDATPFASSAAPTEAGEEIQVVGQSRG